MAEILGAITDLKRLGRGMSASLSGELNGPVVLQTNIPVCGNGVVWV